MKKESFQGILLGIVIMCAVFAFITIAWAAFSTNLTISGTAKINQQSWKVEFVSTKDTALAASAGATLTGTKTGSAELPSTGGFGIDTSHISASGNIGTFNQKGDKITYTWYAQNFGTFDADISVTGTGLLSSVNSNGGNITLSCTKTGDSTNLNDWCSANMVAKLYVGAVDSSSIITSAYTSSLKKATTSNDTDVLEFKLEIEFVGSGSVEVSSDNVDVSISTITLAANQHTTAAATPGP
jgi:hypothetical protein